MVRPVALGVASALALLALLGAAQRPLEAATAAAAWPENRQPAPVVPRRKKPATPKPAPASAASTAEANAERAQGALSSATDALKSARDDVHSAKEKLDALVKEIEDAQPTDSPFAQAKARYDEARSDRKKALASATKVFKQAVENLSPLLDDRAQRVSDLHDSLVTNNEDIRAAVAELAAARPEYESLREALLHKDSRWTEASDALKHAHTAESEADAALQRAARDNLSSQASLREQQARGVPAPKAGKKK